METEWENQDEGEQYVEEMEGIEIEKDFFSNPYVGHYFLVPDTGLLPMALHTEELTGYQCFKMGKEQSFHQWVACCGDVVTRLQGTLADALGLPALQLKAFPAKLPADTGVLQCDVVHIDQYDNVVIDFTRRQYEQYAPGRKFTLHFMRVEEVWTVSNNYNDVREGDKLCRFNSNDHLEICINRGKAASLFGLRLGGKNNNIKIAFQ